MEPDYKFLEEKKVDFKDLFSWLLIKWKTLLCFALIGCALLGVFFFIQNWVKAQERAATPPKRVEDYRAALSEPEAMEVENTYHEYQIFQNYLKDLGRFSAVFLNTENNDGKIMIAEYNIISRLKNCNIIYTDIAITPEDYQTIYKIAHPEDADTEANAGKTDVPVQFISEKDGNIDTYKAGSNEALPSSDTTSLTVFIKADTDEQCDEILNVINASFEKETERLKATDKGISCRLVETGYSSDQNNYYDNAERMIVERLNVVNNSLSTLNNDHIEKFSKEQKKYYDALKKEQRNKKSEENKADTTAPADSAKETKIINFSYSKLDLLKYLLGGLFIGFFLAADVLIIMYVANGKVNSDRELGNFGFPNFHTFYFAKGTGKIYQITRSIRNISTAPIDNQLEMLTQDLSIMMKEMGASKVYLLMTTNHEKDMDTARKIKEQMEKNDLKIIIGNPLSTTEELKKLAECDKVIILASMKKTKKDTIKKAAQVCGRCFREITGFIAIEEY